MASIAALTTGLRFAVGEINAARAALTDLVAGLITAGTAYARLGEGSAQPHLTNAAAGLEHAYDECLRITAIIDRARDHAEALLAVLTGPWQLTDQQGDDVRRELPDPITPDNRGTGRKTHGRWVDPDGKLRRIASGFDEHASQVDRVLESLGYGQLVVASHVELKVAVELRRRFEMSGEPQHATIVQNNVPCPFRLGCATLLSAVLPSGCSLTVHAPNYLRAFIGGAGS